MTVTGTRLPPPAAETGDQARRRHQSAFATRAQQRAAAERELRELRAEAEARSGYDYSRRDAGAAAKASAGAPITLPPVAEDVGLPLEQWFERIRVRRALGETDQARESLALLRREHPGVDLPDDLVELR